jgi:predicted porin
MKKSLIALAVMAAAGAASAQSSVTLFGIVDASISRYEVKGGQHNTVLSNSGYNSSRLGFRGTEDLGGGLSASFWLEGALQNDVGQGGSQTTGFDFRRRSTVSLAGGWGEVRLGRDYVPTFWNMTVFDPFGTNGVGTNIGHKVKLAGATNTATTVGGIVDPAYVRSNNAIAYFLPPNLGGFYGQVTYAFDETPSGTTPDNVGRYAGARLGFGSGPFNVAAAYGRTEGAQTFASPDVRDWNIGGQWDFGVAKLLGVYDRAQYESAGFESTLKTWVIGTLVPVGAGEIRASYGRATLDGLAGAEPRVNQWAIGYVHNLSKRTAVYATYARLKNKDGSAINISSSLNNPLSGATPANSTSSGFDLGIRHSF